MPSIRVFWCAFVAVMMLAWWNPKLPAQVATAAYNLIQDEGVDLTKRRTLDFSGTGITCADDAGNARTLCTVPEVGYGTWESNLGAQTLGTGATGYLLPWSNAIGTIEANSQFIMPMSGHVKNLWFITATAQGGAGSLVVTVRTCTPVAGACSGTNSAVTLTVAAGAAANEFSDVAHSVAVTAGDLVSVQMVNNHSSSSAQIRGWALQLVN